MLRSKDQKTEAQSQPNDSLFNAVFKYFMLLSSHGEHPVEREPILLWPIADLGRFHLNRLEVVMKCDHNLAAFPSFDGIYGTESRTLN